VFIGIFFLLPVVTILAKGLAPDGAFDIGAIGDVLTRPFVLDTIWFTLWQAAGSTALTVVLALPVAFVFARYEFRGKRLLNAAVLIPFVLPTVVVGAAFLSLLGPRGPLGLHLDDSIWAIFLAHVFYNFAVVLRIVGGAWAQLDTRLEEQARVLGATRWRAFRHVTLPLLRGSIASAASIVFLFTFTSFGVILILGGPTFATIEVEIYRQAAQLLDLRVAATLAIVQLLALAALLAVSARFQRRATVATRTSAGRSTARRPRTRADRAFVGAAVLLMAVLLGLPLVLLVERSLATSAGYGIGHYVELLTRSGSGLFVPPSEAIQNSLVFAIVASVLSTVLGLLAAQVIANRGGRIGQALDILLTLPLGTSAVIVGFGFLVTLGSLPIDLRTSPVLIPIAHTVVALPFVVRAVVPVMRSIDRRMREAAAVLGASPVQTWRRIDLPIISRAAGVGAGFAFAVSLGEFGATLFIVRPDTPTIPIAIFRLLGQPGAQSFGQAMAMATVLMAVTAAAVLTIDRFRTPTAQGL
jgi:thiamine transport system permease protein